MRVVTIAIPPTAFSGQHVIKRQQKNLREVRPLKRKDERVASVPPIKVYSQPKYGIDVSYVENPLQPSSIRVSIVYNPRYALNVARSTVSIGDR